MHLSDQQLLNLDSEENTHLHECADCQQRLENLRQMRSRLNECANYTIPDRDLKAQQFRQRMQAQQSESAQIVKLSPRKRIGYWWTAGFALAASVFLAIQILPGSSVSTAPENSFESLDNLITQHQTLLQNYHALSATQSSRANAQGVVKPLTALDQQIQNAYLQNLSEEQIRALWQKKINNINKELQDDKHLLRI